MIPNTKKAWRHLTQRCSVGVLGVFGSLGGLCPLGTLGVIFFLLFMVWTTFGTLGMVKVMLKFHRNCVCGFWEVTSICGWMAWLTDEWTTHHPISSPELRSRWAENQGLGGFTEGFPPKIGICFLLRSYTANFDETSSQPQYPWCTKICSGHLKNTLGSNGVYGEGVGLKIYICFPLWKQKHNFDETWPQPSSLMMYQSVFTL